jgi:hypothetical protein
MSYHIIRHASTAIQKAQTIALLFLCCVVYLLPAQVVTASSLSSTSSDWPMFGYNTAHTRYNSNERLGFVRQSRA